MVPTSDIVGNYTSEYWSQVINRESPDLPLMKFNVQYHHVLLQAAIRNHQYNAVGLLMDYLQIPDMPLKERIAYYQLTEQLKG